MKFPMKTGSRHYNTGEINGVFFTLILSVLGFLIIQYTIRTIFPSLYISSYSIINVLLAVIFGYFFQLSGSGLVGLIPYLPLVRLLFIFGVERDLGIKLNFFEIGSFYFPVNILIFLLFFSLSSSTATNWSLLFPQKEEYPPPMDSKRYYEWVSSPTRRINRLPHLKSISVCWLSFLILSAIIIALIWEWKKDIPQHLWYVIMLYFLVYIIFVWYGLLRIKATERELDGHYVASKLLSKSLQLPIIVLSIVIISSIILPWGYSPLSLTSLGNFLARLFQPKPVDYGAPLPNPLFWRFRTLFPRPKMSLPPPGESIHIPPYVLWILAGTGLILVLLFLIKKGFFSRVVSILKEGFARLLYSVVEITKDLRSLGKINVSEVRMPRLPVREKPTTLMGWIIYYYKVSLNLMAKKNLGKEVWETPYEYARRLGVLRPDIGDSYRELTEIFVTSRYKRVTPKKDWISIMKNRIKEVKEKLG